VELQNKLKELAPQAVIGEGYGLSETIIQGGVCTPLHQYRPGFVGIPQINVDLKIVDQQTGTKELGPNEEGEIAIRAESMMLGYWNKPDETRTMLRDGYVKFLGRTREMIKCSGFSVFPAEVEDLLYRHPAVKEVAVIGVDDDYRGQSPKAFIVAKDQYAGRVTERDILDWCKENMAAYKRPRFITFRADLPKSSAGKLLRRVLVDEERSGRA
jgi:long-chain acyl-CoA synthetase